MLVGILISTRAKIFQVQFHSGGVCNKKYSNCNPTPVGFVIFARAKNIPSAIQSLWGS
jgi:hypothetical protein